MPKRTKQKAKRVPMVFAVAACAQHYADKQANVEPLQPPEVILSEFSGERVNWCLLAVQFAVKKGLVEAGTFSVTVTGGAYLNTVESKLMLLMGAMRSKLDAARVQMTKDQAEGRMVNVDPASGQEIVPIALKLERKRLASLEPETDTASGFLIEKTDPFNGMTLEEVVQHDKEQASEQ